MFPSLRGNVYYTTSRVMLEKKDRRAITIKQLNKMKILNKLQERHKYNMVHPRWATSTHKLSILLLLYCPAK